MKIIKIFLIAIFLSSNAFAGSDGELELSKKNKPTKDCFEKINRASFALNQGLDKAIFKPVAKGYRKLPSPIKTGASNALENLSSLITIPNNVLQGDLKTAGINTFRLVVNTTVGILGIVDVADKMGFPDYVKEDRAHRLGNSRLNGLITRQRDPHTTLPINLGLAEQPQLGVRFLECRAQIAEADIG